MTDDISMRFQLQKVALYRGLCRSVRRSGRHNVLLALLMLFLAYSAFQMQAAAGARLFALVYIGLALAELAVGLFKSVFPSAEGVFLDGVVLLLFAGWVIARQVLVKLGGGEPTVWLVLLGLYLLWGAFGRFREYRHLRALFADRPTPDQLTWFDDLVREIRAADPEVDDQSLDLPTTPKLKAKLLGTTAFFVGTKSDSVIVAGPDDFAITPDPKQSKGGLRHVALWVHDQEYPPFDIDDASWSNYRRWVAANTAPNQE